MLLSINLSLFGAGFVSALSAQVLGLNEAIIPNAYLVQLNRTAASSFTQRSISQHEWFHKRAVDVVDYTVRHSFTNADVFFGLSVTLDETATNADLKTLLELPGVVDISPVYAVPHPEDPISNSSITQTSSTSSSQLSMPKLRGSQNSLLSALEMTGVDKLHKAGIKGKGIRIGIVDSGIDYRHPALGGGFGPGFKVEGGYSFVDDLGAKLLSSDPLSTCLLGGHGTHVAGIIGMNALNETGFDIVGVAPEATLYMYRAFGCKDTTGTDVLVAAMIKAFEDGVDILSMSIGGGSDSWLSVNPYESVVTALKNSGIAVIVGAGNFGAYGLYTESDPGGSANAITVGSVSNTHFPLVYEALDNQNLTIPYASVWPLDPRDRAVYIITPGCDSSAWELAFATVDLNNTLLAFQLGPYCQLYTAQPYWINALEYVMAFNAPSTNPYAKEYNVPYAGAYGDTAILSINATYSTVMIDSYIKAGGYPNYKMQFPNRQFSSVPQQSGGMMSSFSGWGPRWLSYDFKPQLSAPGGHILSTWPLGVHSGYAIASGTSMSTPYASGCYALIKSQFRNYTVDQIRELLQTTSSPIEWVYNISILSSTAQQGSGLINPFKAIVSQTELSPGEIRIGDDSHTEWGHANVTIRNKSPLKKTYKLSHVGAGYANYVTLPNELQQSANYGEADFNISLVTVAPGKEITVPFSVSPPSGVVPRQLPVFSGYIQVAADDGEILGVPYVGAPYSIYNGDYIDTRFVNGVQLPYVWTRDANSTVVINSGNFTYLPSQSITPYISTEIIQFSKVIRIDVLPANTTILATRYGFDRTIIHDYNPSALTPNSSILGYPSFGTIYNKTTVIYPPKIAQQWVSSKVLSPNGVSYSVGNGDYRFFLSVLRWGGIVDNPVDYDTWLGPIVKLTG